VPLDKRSTFVFASDGVRSIGGPDTISVQSMSRTLLATWHGEGFDDHLHALRLEQNPAQR